MPCPAAPEYSAAPALNDAKSASRFDRSIGLVALLCVDPTEVTGSPLMYTCTLDVAATVVVATDDDGDDGGVGVVVVAVAEVVVVAADGVVAVSPWSESS